MDVEKLLAAIEETERIAKKALKEHPEDAWVVRRYRHEGILWEYMRVANSVDPGAVAPAVAEHIAHNDPAAVLRRCAQDRLMVEAVQRHTEGHPGEHTNEEDPYDSCELCVEWNANALPERVLDYLARGYGISVEEETTGE